jgi:hypothetical protein
MGVINRTVSGGAAITLAEENPTTHPLSVQARRRIAYGLADGFYPVEKTKWEKTAA